MYFCNSEIQVKVQETSFKSNEQVQKELPDSLTVCGADRDYIPVEQLCFIISRFLLLIQYNTKKNKQTQSNNNKGTVTDTERM